MTHTRPTHRPAQTIGQAKRDFKKYGPRVSSQEQRRLARSAELYERAQRIRENEKRKEVAAKKKQEKEDREREARHRMNIPSPRSGHYVRPSQPSLLGFVKVGKAIAWDEPSAVLKDNRDPSQSLHISAEYSDEDNAATACSHTSPWEEDGVDDTSLIDVLDMALQCSDTRTPALGMSSESQCQHPEQPSPNFRVTSQLQSPDTEHELLDAWDDFLASNTQIEREIASPPSRHGSTPDPTNDLGYEADPFFDFPFLSTQDVSFDPGDLDELGIARPQQLEAPPALFRDPTVFVKDFADCPRQTKLTSGRKRSRSQESRDRALMPPPKRPLKPASQDPISAQPCALLADLSPTDFDLSTQDIREIDV